jgi:hypothetical protein
MRIALIIGAFLSAAIAFAGDYTEEINRRFEQNRTASYPAGEFSARIPFAVGQWALYGNVDDDGDKSITKYSIVARRDDYWTLETMVMNEDNVTTTQYEVRGIDAAMNSGNVDDLNFRVIRVKTDDNEPVVLEGCILTMSKAMYKEAMKSWVQSNTNLVSAGAVTVPAGTFAGTTKAHTKMSVMGKEVEADCWLSPSVPINSVVRTNNTDGYSTVLLDFGMSGATASC